MTSRAATPLVRRGGRADLFVPVAATITLAAATGLPRHDLLLLGGAAVGLAAVALLVRYPYLLAPLVIVGFTLQPAVKFFVSSQVGPAKDGIVLLGVLAFAVTVMSRRAARADRLLLVSVGLLVATLVVNPAGRHDAGWAFVVRLSAESFGLLLLGYLMPEPGRTWRWAAYSAVGVGLAESALGVAQQGIGVTNLVTKFGYAYGEQVRQTAGGQLRSFGTLDDPFNYATLTLLGLVCALYIVRRPRLRWLSVGVLCIGVLVSFDRTAFVLLVVIFALHLDLIGRRRAGGLLFAAAALAVLALLLAKGPTPPPTVTPATGPTSSSFLLTLNGRTSTWLSVVRGPEDLLFGRGAGAIGAGLSRASQGSVVQQARYQPSGTKPGAAATVPLTSLDSSYVEMVADGGLVGLVVLLVIGARVVTLLRSAGRPLSPAAGAGLGILLVIALDGLTRTSLTAFPFGFVALYLLGVSLAACTGPRT